MKVTDFASIIKWYDENARTYASNIHPHIDVHTADKFIDYLSGIKILDAGFSLLECDFQQDMAGRQDVIWLLIFAKKA